MLDGFQPKDAAIFFERRRAYSLLVALVSLGGPVAYVIDSAGQPEKTVEVTLEPEIEDFAVQEEEKPEPEPEPEEPPPPPPPNAKIKVVDSPVARPKVETPDKKVTDVADESDREKVIEVAAGHGDPSHIASTGRGDAGAAKKPAPAKPPAPPKVEEKPKKPKKTEQIDPTKPIDRPANASAPKPLGSNAVPAYPAKLRDVGTTGRYVVKLLVYRDGTVRGMKILRKSNTATGSAAQAEADKAFLAEVVKVVKGWKYQPSTLEGTPITVWHTVTIPFTLTQ